MIITEKTAKKLVKAGKATLTTIINHDGEKYQALDRHDKQRVDHYIVK